MTSPLTSGDSKRVYLYWDNDYINASFVNVSLRYSLGTHTTPYPLVPTLPPAPWYPHYPLPPGTHTTPCPLVPTLPPASLPSLSYLPLTLQGYHKPSMFIATQVPLPGTVADLWKMVTHYKCSIIVQLYTLSEGERVRGGGGHRGGLGTPHSPFYPGGQWGLLAICQRDNSQCWPLPDHTGNHQYPK